MSGATPPIPLCALVVPWGKPDL